MEDQIVTVKDKSTINSSGGGTQRIVWVDIAKYICIMFVIVQHLESTTTLLYNFYSPFYLTLFFLLSGYVYKKPGSFKELLIKKIKGLFIPWLIWSVFNILLSAVISFRETNLVSELLWNFAQIRGLGDGLWFVAALFVAFIPFYFLQKMDKPIVAIIIAFCLSFASEVYMELMNPDLLPWGRAALPWHIETIFTACFWMLLGYYFKTKWEQIFDKFNKIYIKIGVWVVYIGLLFVPTSIMPWFVSIPFSYIKSIVGIAAVISLCKIIPSNKYMKFVGANTLFYFALHGKVYAVLEKLLNTFVTNAYQYILSNVYLSSVFAICLALLVSVILILPAMFVNRFLPWTVGRKYKKKEKINENATG